MSGIGRYQLLGGICFLEVPVIGIYLLLGGTGYLAVSLLGGTGYLSCPFLKVVCYWGVSGIGR